MPRTNLMLHQEKTKKRSSRVAFKKMMLICV